MFRKTFTLCSLYVLFFHLFQSVRCESWATEPLTSEPDSLLVAFLLLSSPAGVPLASLGSGSVAGEALGTEGGVAVIEEHHGVTAAHNGRHLRCGGTQSGGTVRQPSWTGDREEGEDHYHLLTSLVPGQAHSQAGHRDQDEEERCNDNKCDVSISNYVNTQRDPDRILNFWNLHLFRSFC